MNIVYASDNNFAEILGISMTSLFENNKSSSEIVVYILDDGINEENKENLKLISDRYGRQLDFIDVKPLLNSEMNQERGSLSTFSRLYMEKLIPSDVRKLLYIDCDIIVSDSLEEMYSTDISEVYCAGISDCLSDAHLELIGLKSGDNYFNAGVLLVNLDMWRTEKMCDRFETFSDSYNGNVPYADQDIINGVLSHKSIALDLKNNFYTALYDFSYKDLMIFRKPSKFYSEEEVEEAKKNPVIVHFTTSFLSLRPWIEGCQHPFAKEWIRYKAMTPWADVPMRADNRSAKKKLAVKVYKMMPNNLAVGIAGLLHSKIVPMLRRRGK